MINLVICSSDKVADHQIEYYSKSFPLQIQEYIQQKKNIHDRKCTLIGLMMLKDRLAEDGSIELLSTWGKDSKSKPFLKCWNHFSISHSGTQIVFCDSREQVGIDLEEISPMDLDGIAIFFHKAEKAHLEASDNFCADFFRLWVKKESFLKCIGTGLLNGIEQFNCLGQSIIFEGLEYFFLELPIFSGFECSICTVERNSLIRIKSLSFD